MKPIVVIGGGPAGAHAAARLAGAGMRTVLMDEKLAWEKPCGGGLTYKAYQQFPFLLDNDTPKKLVHQTWLEAGRAGRVRMDLDHPILIYSRRDLNQLILRRAEQAGAQIERTRVLGLGRTAGGWSVKTRSGTLDASFCIIATGARNPLRAVGTEWTAADTLTALGYFVPADQPHIDIRFFDRFQGYIWVFPRCGHLSVGICGREPAQSMRARLDRYMDEHAITRAGAQFYAHALPSLGSASWRKNRSAGDGWLAAGDAAGLVDPITGEGIYYAVRSGDLAAQVVLDESLAPEAKPAAYQSLIEQDFARDLYLGSLLAARVYLGRFLFDTVPNRMVQFARRSPLFRSLLQDLFAGTQGYDSLGDRLLRELRPTLRQIAWSFVSRRLLAPA